MKSSSSSPFFSVVIPSYNRLHTLPTTLNSVLSQTFTDFEVIVVDDGSTDNTSDLFVERFTDPRIRYIYIPNSGSPSKPRNVGIENALGDWICFLDADDHWIDSKLMVVFDNIRTHKNSVLHAHNVFLCKTDQVVGRYVSGSPVGFHSFFLLNFSNILSTSAVTVSRSFIISENIVFNEDSSVTGVEDYGFWMDIALSHGAFNFINSELGFYQIFEDSLSSDTNMINRNLLSLFSLYAQKYPSLSKLFKSRYVFYKKYCAFKDSVGGVRKIIRLLSIFLRFPLKLIFLYVSSLGYRL